MTAQSLLKVAEVGPICPTSVLRVFLHSHPGKLALHTPHSTLQIVGGVVQYIVHTA